MPENKPIKLAKASVSYGKEVALFDNYLTTDDTDKLSIPKDHFKQLELCRFFYKREPVTATVLNKIVDSSITSIINQNTKCSDLERYTYDFMKPMLHEFFRNACLEYLLSGIVIPHYEWTTVKGSQINPNLAGQRRINVPTNIWFRDPFTITLKRNIAIPNKIDIYVKIDQELINFINTGGRNKDGTMDVDTYKSLENNYPEFVKKIKSGDIKNMSIKLENVRPIFGKTLVNEDYPIPYMFSALEPLMHKRNIRRMDYSIASRVIAAIQLIKLGNNEFPVTDEEDFADIKMQFDHRNASGETERVFQLFANHTLTIEWVYPDTSAMLNREKYSEVDEDIIAAFGFPRSLITGETLRSMTSQADLAIFSPIATMEAIRDKLIQWAYDLYKEIAERNNFKHVAVPKFEPLLLHSLKDLIQLGQELYKEGHISRRTRVEMFGIDLDTEIDRQVQEKALYEDNKLPAYPPTPYSKFPPGIEDNKEET